VLTVHHGGIIPLPDEQAPPEENPKETSDAWPFDYMFRELQDDAENLLPESETTAMALRYLGTEAMGDPGEIIPGVPVPAIHTFLGQFIDHDITLLVELGADQTSLAKPTPLSPKQIKEKIVNARSPNLDLDNVYGPDFYGQFSPREPNSDKMLIGKVVEGTFGLPKGKDEWNDLPRRDNGSARIGDSRDDENLIIAQLHVAFLRAHNAIVERGFRFYEARKLLIQHYQWIVLNDFLDRIADSNIVKMIKYKGARFFNPSARNFFMPLEFSIAAYRFGHSKVRPSYDRFNEFQGGLLNELFSFTHRHLPDDWVIQWPSFLDAENPGRFPRRIDTSLAGDLLTLTETQLNGHEPTEGNLAVRNLLRGYILRMPTGQAVANAMAPQGIHPLTPDQIMSVANEIPVLIPEPGHRTQADTLQKTKTFLEKTPLWFYILAEAAFYSRGYHLGPVGSTIVAEVLIGVLRNSTYSILADPHWRPTLGETPGKFDIEDLLKLADVI
jgi:Animal haem peroxidase